MSWHITSAARAVNTKTFREQHSQSRTAYPCYGYCDEYEYAISKKGAEVIVYSSILRPFLTAVLLAVYISDSAVDRLHKEVTVLKD